MQLLETPGPARADQGQHLLAHVGTMTERVAVATCTRLTSCLNASKIASASA